VSKPYQPPISLIHLTMQQAAGAAGALAVPGYADTLAELVPTALESAGRFAAEVLSPLNPIGDRVSSRLVDGRVVTPPGFVAAYRRFCEDGWVSLAVPEEHGGQGLPLLLGAAVTEIWGGANLSFAMCPELVVGALELMRVHAAPALLEQYAPRLASGEWAGAMALTEPQAGSDLSGLTTRAEPDEREPGVWRLHGRKIFISWGDHDLTPNIVHFVLARAPGAPPGVKGISLFLVPMRLLRPDGTLEDNELRALSVEHKMGIHASPTCVMALGEGAGARGWLMGRLHAGLACMFTMMSHMRLGVGLHSVGLAERALQLARAHAQERIQGRDARGAQQPIIEHADVRRMLLTMKALTQAARGLAYTGAATLDVAHRSGDAVARRAATTQVELLTPVIKAWCSDTAVEVASLGVQVHGGTGFIDDAEISQIYRDARIGPIFEGTNYIQAQDLLGRKVLRDRGAALRGLLTQMEADARRLPEGREERLCAGLLEGCARLREASAWLLQRQTFEPELVGATAHDFLQWLGVLAGAWQHVVSVLQAADGSHAREVHDMAVLYATHVLPRSLTHEAVVREGAGAVTEALITDL
jgi:alkylation response protein AidB-like acyl-CoA dehydrogenase